MADTGGAAQAGLTRDGIDLGALKSSFNRIVRVAMTLLGAADGEVSILLPGQAPFRSKGVAQPNTAFTERLIASTDGVWVEDLLQDHALAAALPPKVLE